MQEVDVENERHNQVTVFSKKYDQLQSEAKFRKTEHF
jgi:hypothetical protein